MAVSLSPWVPCGAGCSKEAIYVFWPCLQTQEGKGMSCTRKMIETQQERIV